MPLGEGIKCQKPTLHNTWSNACRYWQYISTGIKQILNMLFKLNKSEPFFMAWNAWLMSVKAGWIYPSSEMAVGGGQKELVCLVGLMSR